MTEDMSGVTFKVETYDVLAFSDVFWKYFGEISIQIDPIKVHMTDQLIECILNYFGQDNNEDEEKKPDNLAEFR